MFGCRDIHAHDEGSAKRVRILHASARVHTSSGRVCDRCPSRERSAACNGIDPRSRVTLQSLQFQVAPNGLIDGLVLLEVQVE